MLKSSDGNGREAEMNQKAAADLIGEIIRLAKPRKDELIYAVIGAPAQASMQNKQLLVDAAREALDAGCSSAAVALAC